MKETNIKTKFPINIYVKDWRFWYKLILFAYVTSMVMYSVMYDWIHIGDIYYTNSSGQKVQMYYYEWYDSSGKVHGGYNVLLYVFHTFMFFTNQSNMLVSFWLLYAVIHHKDEGKRKILSNYFSTGVALYITVTSIVAMWYMLPLSIISGLLGKGQSANPMGGSSGTVDGGNALFNTFNVFSLHLFGPVLFILYVTLWLKKEKVVSKTEFIKKYLVNYSIYPIAYIIVTTICSIILWKSNVQYAIQAPYFCFYVWQNGSDGTYPLPGIPVGGWFWAILTVVIMVAIVIGFGVLYNSATIIMNIKGNEELKKQYKQIRKEKDQIKINEFIAKVNEILKK